MIMYNFIALRARCLVPFAIYLRSLTMKGYRRFWIFEFYSLWYD